MARAVPSFFHVPSRLLARLQRQSYRDRLLPFCSQNTKCRGHRLAAHRFLYTHALSNSRRYAKAPHGLPIATLLRATCRRQQGARSAAACGAGGGCATSDAGAMIVGLGTLRIRRARDFLGTALLAWSAAAGRRRCGVDRCHVERYRLITLALPYLQRCSIYGFAGITQKVAIVLSCAISSIRGSVHTAQRAFCLLLSYNGICGYMYDFGRHKYSALDDTWRRASDGTARRCRFCISRKRDFRISLIDDIESAASRKNAFSILFAPWPLYRQNFVPDGRFSRQRIRCRHACLSYRYYALSPTAAQ